MRELITKSILTFLAASVCVVGLPVSSYSQENQKARILLPVRVNGVWGYVNGDGVLVIKPRFAVAGDFSEGLAAVRDEEGWFYYIDGSGKVVTGSRQYRLAREFSEGLAAQMKRNLSICVCDWAGDRQSSSLIEKMIADD